MTRLALTGVACLALAGCDLVGPGNDEEQQPLLEVTARSATTLTLRWATMGSTNTYTVDFLTGLTRCEDFPHHIDVFHVNGTTVQLTALTPATLYHIHVHALPHGSSEDPSTNVVLVTTLSTGSSEQPIAPSDYQSCRSRG